MTKSPTALIKEIRELDEQIWQDVDAVLAAVGLSSDKADNVNKIMDFANQKDAPTKKEIDEFISKLMKISHKKPPK